MSICKHIFWQRVNTSNNDPTECVWQAIKFHQVTDLSSHKLGSQNYLLSRKEKLTRNLHKDLINDNYVTSEYYLYQRNILRALIQKFFTQTTFSKDVMLHFWFIRDDTEIAFNYLSKYLLQILHHISSYITTVSSPSHHCNVRQMNSQLKQLISLYEDILVRNDWYRYISLIKRPTKQVKDQRKHSLRQH